MISLAEGDQDDQEMKFLAGCVAAVALQWALVSRASVGTAAADLPLAFLVYSCLRGMPWSVPFGAWGMGLSLDLLGTTPPGLRALCFMAIGLAARASGASFDPGALTPRMAVLAGAALFWKTVQALALAADGAEIGLGTWIRHVALSSAMTVVAGAALFIVLDWCLGAPGLKSPTARGLPSEISTVSRGA